MGRWSRELAPLLVKFAGVRDGDAVLDVGSGTGALATAVAARAPSSRIIGIDPAASYVAFAQTRHPGDRVGFEVGDAQQLRFADGSFDRTLSLLVLNFIPHPTKALDEMVRVARPGGTISGAVWDYGQGMEMLRIFWDEAVALNPAADARDERHMALSREGQLDALWRALRLQDVAEEALTIQTRFSSFDDYWLPFLEKQGPAGDYVATLTASASSFDCGCGNGYLAIGRTVQSNCALVPGPCEASCHNGRGSNQTQRPPITILFKVFTEGICGRTRPR
jgi:hypothetical protein